MTEFADEKTAPPYGYSVESSPTIENSSSTPNFSSNPSCDLESGRKPLVRTPTWSYTLFGRGQKPDVSRKELKLKRQEMLAGIKETETRSLESCPDGYPRLAGFLSSENNFSLYRGFSYLHARVLLQLQDEISALEQELDDLDNADAADGRTKNLKRARWDKKHPRPEDDGFRPRAEILADIHRKLLEYDEMLMKARDIQAFPRPSERDYRSVRSWFWNESPISNDAEASFIRKKEDIVSLRSGREWSGFDGLVENTLRRLDCPLTRRLFCTQELRDKTTSREIYYYSASRVESFVGLIITSIIFVLLVLPVVAMYKLTSIPNNQHGTFQAIGVLVVFTLLFSAAMSLLTKARRHELFAAAAAYCAVLVVFVSNFSNNGPVG